MTENEQSFTRPAIVDIIRQVMDNLNIPKDTSIFYPGDNDKIAQAGSVISNADTTARIETGRYISTEIEDDYSEETVYNTMIDDKEQIPIFDDPAITFSVRPIYTQNRITISITYRTPSKTEATRFRDDMYIRFAKARTTFIHSVTYHYPLDENIYSLIEMCYDRIEAIEGYGQTLENYVKNNSTNRITLVSDLVNKNRNLVVRETQKRIIGMFDYREFPDKPIWVESTQTYDIKLNYQFTFDRPVGYSVRYPSVVHNQLLPKEFVTFYDQDKVPGDYLNTPSSYRSSLAALSNFESDLIPYHNANIWKYIKIPNWDDFILKNVPNYSATIINALTLLETDNPKFLLDLTDLGPAAIDSDILDFMLNSEAPYMTTIYQSVFLLHVYINDQPLDYKAVTLDSTGKLNFVNQQSFRNTYHVRLAVMLDFSLLREAFFDRLMLYPKAALKLFIAIIETLKNFPGMANTINNSDGSGGSLGDFIGFLTFLGFINPDGSFNYNGNITPLIYRLRNLKGLSNYTNLDSYIIDSLVLTNYIAAERMSSIS